jgi:hypothetical protein
MTEARTSWPIHALSVVTMFVVLGASSVFAEDTGGDRRNIILIPADDMGAGEPSHEGGVIPTPWLDRGALRSITPLEGDSPFAGETGNWSWAKEVPS